MKKLLGALLLCGALSGIAKADTIHFDIGDNSFYLPFQVVNATQLYSFEDGRGYPGLETVLAVRGDLELTIGAAPVLGSSENVPFVGLQAELSPRFFDTSNNDLLFGVWVGQASDESQPTWGIKASIELW